MKQELVAILHASSAITALVPAARINWKKNPQGSGYPYITIHGVGRNIGSTLKGPDSIEFTRVQINCMALTYREAEVVGEAVLALLNHYRDDSFRLITFEGDGDLQDGGSNEAVRLFGVRLDFLIRWRA